MNKIMILCLMLAIFASCNKEDIMRYDRSRAAIEFDEDEVYYSFKTSFKQVDTVEIPFSLVGYAEDWARNAEFTVVSDNTTATANDFQIVDAVMEANAYEGNLCVRVENKEGDNFKDARIYFEIADGKDFIPGIDENKYCFLYLTNSLVRPSSWGTWQERYFLGTYSTAYYSFIIEVTGETEFPYPNAVAGYNNGEVWSGAYKDAFLANLEKELKARNEREGSPLMHDDGTAAGKEVIIGMYYTN